MFTPPQTFVYTPQFQIPRNNPAIKVLGCANRFFLICISLLYGITAFSVCD